MEDKAIINLNEYLKIKRKAEWFDYFKDSLEMRKLESYNYEVLISDKIFRETFGRYLDPEYKRISMVNIKR